MIYSKIYRGIIFIVRESRLKWTVSSHRPPLLHADEGEQCSEKQRRDEEQSARRYRNHERKVHTNRLQLALRLASAARTSVPEVLTQNCSEKFNDKFVKFNNKLLEKENS